MYFRHPLWRLPQFSFHLFTENAVFRAVCRTFFPLVLTTLATFVEAADRPNVILIMSDDQGGADYGFQGNPLIRTPHLDAMRRRGGLMSRFYVSPVCAPTRASLMTGRYNYRTRCIDTYVGRAMMDADEVTIAESLREAGYRTGIYGKWHLGDNYPLRPMDQGFEDSLVHRGGGIGQPSDPIGAEGKYTNPTLIENGEEVQKAGYCTDIYFDAAMKFMESHAGGNERFFTYIATNAPHGPFHDVPPSLYEEYRQVDFSPIIVKKMKPEKLKAENDKLARIAAMVTNIDDNVGRLFSKLVDLGIADNTIVIYMNDNGPNTMRYVGDMRGMKTNVDDGGIRSPLIVHWPRHVKPGMESDTMCAHIDVAPTILDACGVSPPSDRKIDGRSLLPLLKETSGAWPTRQLVFQSHRGNAPQKFHHFAIHEHPWKLVHPSGFGRESIDSRPELELYNLQVDPQQKVELSEQHPDVAQRLTAAYENWFQDVSNSRPDNYAPPRIVVGTEHEPESVLTRQDWRHEKGRPWASNSNGVWLLNAPKATDFDVELIFAKEHSGGSATITVGEVKANVRITSSERRGHMASISMPAGNHTLAVNVDFDGDIQGPHQVILKRK